MNADTEPTAEMCLDERLLTKDKGSIRDPFRKSIFGFIEPSEMGYRPTLLSFICDGCKVVKTFDNLKEFEDKQKVLKKCLCTDKGERSRWRQLDIVFVHPNGNYSQPLPWQWFYDDRSHGLIKTKNRCEVCGSDAVCLDDKSSQIGKRFYYCANPRCNTARADRWLQNDKEYLTKFSPSSANPRPIEEIRMKPVSYRSNAVHYSMQDMIIDFGKSDRLEILTDRTDSKLIKAVAERFDITGSKPDLDAIREALLSKGLDDDWQKYELHKNELEKYQSQPGCEALVDTFSGVIQGLEKKWEEQGVFSSNLNLPSNLLNNLSDRNERFARKHDPFRLLIEHGTLLEELVSEKQMDNGMRYFTPMDDLDEFVGPENEEDRKRYNKDHRRIMDSAGIETLGLLRKFQTIQYSFGYTRVDSNPVTKYINERIVPVRLRLFEQTNIDDERKNPIFVLKQNNEAIYVRLNEKVVRKWLESIDSEEGVSDDPIGLQYLSNAMPMRQFLDSLPSESLKKPSFSLALYSLLHTYSHHLIQDIAEFSGLSAGSLGEYIFPADLAFIVYRRGMTMDLGNLTSMLRNNSPAFLDYLDDPRNLGCGSGSMCFSKGGACPDCLLIPEVSCIAQNNLLSRTLLIGKDSPRKYGFKKGKTIRGYLDIAREVANS